MQTGTSGFSHVGLLLAWAFGLLSDEQMKFDLKSMRQFSGVIY